MPVLNSDIPVFDAFCRAEFLYDLQEHEGEYERCTVFGVASLQGRALGFHVLLLGSGAVIWRLPIHALAAREGVEPIRLDYAELWDCFSYELAVTEFKHLSARRGMTILKDGSKHEGRYLFTVDWYGNDYAENPGDSGHKCAHILELDSGQYVAQPNNRLLWADPAVISEPFKVMPDFKTNTHEWHCEHDTKWVTTGEERMFYGVEERDRLPVPANGTAEA